ncbi:CRISPR-associated endonuclease Cas2 [Corynebacterium diphtheriae]
MPKKGSDPVWCVVMFDLPVKTKTQRKQATAFRQNLLDLGFCMAQLSVYVQYLPLAAKLSNLVKLIKEKLPPGGDVRILSVSDIQWSKMIRFSSSAEVSGEEKPDNSRFFRLQVAQKTMLNRIFWAT